MIRRNAMAVLTAAAAALVLGAGSAQAATTAPAQDSAGIRVAQEVRGLLAHNPGSVQIGTNAVRVAGGVITVRPDSASGRCPDGHLCLFVDSNFNGDQWTSSATSCAKVNLHNYFTSSGVSWAYRASSIDNPVPRPSGSARFYHNGAFVIALLPGHYLKNLASDSSADGGTANDKIDTLTPC